MRRVRCRQVSEKDAIVNAMWCERPYKETAEDHLRVTPIRSGRHRYRRKRLARILYIFAGELRWNHDYV